VKDCKDCQHSYRDGRHDEMCKCASITKTDKWFSLRTLAQRSDYGLCGPEAKYYKDKRDI
jgi:hypothetical protein